MAISLVLIHNLSCVPQGSIFDPYLFNIYINNIRNINKVAKFVIYRHDTTLLFSTTHVLFAVANKTLQKLELWFISNALNINKYNIKAIPCRPQNRAVDRTFDITLGTTRIELVETFKTLGVLFNKKCIGIVTESNRT